MNKKYIIKICKCCAKGPRRTQMIVNENATEATPDFIWNHL